MPAVATHFKLGLFTLFAIAGIVAIALGLGLHLGGRDRVQYRTYFDESIHGLDLGAPVEYRGVPVGRVAAIRIAPDRAHVEVVLGIEHPVALALGLDAPPPSLRAQLGLQGVTGLKYVDLDLADPAIAAPPALPFAPGARYIPARRSLLEGIAAGLDAIGAKLPAVVDATVTGLSELERVLAQFRSEGLPARVSTLVAELSGAVGDLRAVLRHVDRARLPERVGAAVDAASVAIARVDDTLHRIDGDGGLIASAQRATDAIGDLGLGAAPPVLELEHALRDIGDAARALRDLVETIERDPDMLVKGRARRREP
jgi:ABC-type transporter Mla subunit MlaD